MAYIHICKYYILYVYILYTYAIIYDIISILIYSIYSM